MAVAVAVAGRCLSPKSQRSRVLTVQCSLLTVSTCVLSVPPNALRLILRVPDPPQAAKSPPDKFSDARVYGLTLGDFTKRPAHQSINAAQPRPSASPCIRASTPSTSSWLLGHLFGPQTDAAVADAMTEVGQADLSRLLQTKRIEYR